ncbi:grpE protein homolog 2, mitochondrial-like [Andrographis paniculata]|uniref:grpE protein homolog 2, mitochondrial-like n=1 Tax=Andrographis paniculata TaxID=175694 RepID=UPI0021E85B70|nr:grpE protein homolog 2, mitochondrial-like [Andrographis paniculata]
MSARLSRAVLAPCRYRTLFIGRRDSSGASYSSNLLHSPSRLYNQVSTGQVSLLHHSAQRSSPFQWFGFSSASAQPNDKEPAQPGHEEEMKVSDDSSSVNGSEMGQDSVAARRSNASETIKARNRGTKRVAFSDSESDGENDLSREDLLKRVMEKEQLLSARQEELDHMKDKVLRTFAEIENVKERNRRDSENAKKFAIQNFAKSLLDVADNLGRASSAAKDSFSKIDASKDTTGAVQQLKALLEGVEMTEKQLSEVFKKSGLEKYDPTDEEFDPNRHNAVFQLPDPSKPADHVAVVLKAGYMLHDRVIRPAEVGVTVATSN